MSIIYKYIYSIVQPAEQKNLSLLKNTNILGV